MCTRPARIQADSLVSSSSHSRGCCWCVGQVNTSLRGCGRSLHTFTPSKLCNVRWSERGIAHGVATDYTSMHASAQCIRSMAHVSPTHLPHTRMDTTRVIPMSRNLSHTAHVCHTVWRSKVTRGGVATQPIAVKTQHRLICTISSTLPRNTPPF